MYDIKTLERLNREAVEAAYNDRVKNVYRLYIGKNDGETEKQEFPDIYFETWIADCLTSNDIPAFTMYEAKGFWMRMPENSLVIEIIDSNLPTVRKVAGMMKDQFRQNEVLLTVQQLEVHRF